MKRLTTIFLAFVAVFSLSVAVVGPTALALDPASQITKGVNTAGGGSSPSLGTQIKKVVNVLLFILGMIAVIMIVVGGLQYTTSGGDSSQTKKAKDTILYSVVGLIVAMLAYAIVNFVVAQFK